MLHNWSFCSFPNYDFVLLWNFAPVEKSGGPQNLLSLFFCNCVYKWIPIILLLCSAVVDLLADCETMRLSKPFTFHWQFGNFVTRPSAESLFDFTWSKFLHPYEYFATDIQLQHLQVHFPSDLPNTRDSFKILANPVHFASFVFSTSELIDKWKQKGNELMHVK